MTLLGRKPGKRRTPLGKNQLTIKAGIEADHNECILWTGPVSRYGYGLFTYHDGAGVRRCTTAPRFVLMATAGPPPQPDMQAGHEPQLCNEAGCVNHRHLRWVTPQENNDDQLLTGTSQRKLTDAQVVAILHDDRSNKDVAAEYGVTPTCISLIRSGHERRRAWAKSGLPLPPGARLAS